MKGMIAAVLILAGCHWVFPHAPDQPVPAADASADRTRGDVRRDVRALDRLRVDVASDAGRDAARDVVKPDGPLDKGKAEAAKPDKGPTDKGEAEAPKPVPDKAKLEASTTGCAQGATVALTYSAVMKICVDSGAYLNQCQAESLCGSGWHLCTASEYLSRGGASKGMTNLAWIKACVRSGGGPKAPADGLCDTLCPSEWANSTYTAWHCSDGAPVFDLAVKFVGVVSNSLCFQIGVNSASTAGHWAPLAVSTGTSAAVCCTP